MIGACFRRIRLWFAGWLGRVPPATYALTYVAGDELPAAIPERTVVVARDGGDLWVAGMMCPCDCGRRIELMLLPQVRPRWDLRVGKIGLPSLYPSVWVNDGCRSHFWLRDGEVEWCID